MASEVFQASEVVYLRCGCKPMTVAKVTGIGDAAIISCWWVHDQIACAVDYPAIVLTHFDPDKVGLPTAGVKYAFTVGQAVKSVDFPLKGRIVAQLPAIGGVAQYRYRYMAPTGELLVGDVMEFELVKGD